MTDIIVEITGAGGATNLQALTDVDLTGAVNGQVLTYDGTDWIPTAASGVTTLAALDDTDTTGVADGYILEYNSASGKFEAVVNSGGAGASALDDLTDVTITTPSAGGVLRYSGSEWVDAQLAYGDLSGTPTLSTVATSGSYTDLLNVPSSFTPAAHTHFKADITDFSDGDYATAAQGTKADTAIQSGANISVFVNDAGYLTSAPVTSVAGRTGAVVIAKGDIADFGSYATPAQGALADSATQPGDNISTLTNDAGYITSAPAAPVDSVAGKTGVVTLVKADITDFSDGDYATAAQGATADTALQNITLEPFTALVDSPASYTGQQGKLVKVNATEDGLIFGDPSGVTVGWGDITGTLSSQTDLQSALDGKAATTHTHVKADITDFSDGDYATAAQGTKADSAIQSGANISLFTNDQGYITSAPVDSVAGRTGAVVIVKSDIADFGSYATPAQGALADTAIQSGDNVSVLVNDAGYLTTAPVASVAGKTGVVTLVKADITDLNEEDYAQAKISASDTTSGYLGDKITNGLGIQVNTLNGGADEDLEIKMGPHYLSLASTGLYTGGTLSVGVAPGTIDIAAGEGLYVDSTTTFPTVDVQPVTITQRTSLPITNLATQPVSYILIDKDDNVVQLSAFPTAQQRRENIFLGVAVHSNNLAVEFVNNLPTVALDATAQTHDLMNAFGFFSLDGNIVSPNGANLSFNKSAGHAFKEGANFTTNPKDPHTLTLGAKVASSFRYRNQDSSEGGAVTLLDPTTYDNGGVTTSVPANNNATIQRVYIFPSNEIRIQRGQTVYANLSAAVDAIGKEAFVVEPNIEENGLLIASVAITKTASNLSDSSEALIFVASKFGELGSVGSSAIGTLQDVYNNSVNPEIVVEDGANRGLTIQDSATNVNRDNILEVLTTASAEVFSVTRTDTTVTGNFNVTGTVDGRDVAADGTKLDGIESGATADQTGAEIKVAYEGEADTNAFTDANVSALASATQPGDNVSTLTNDAGYTTASKTTLQTTDATTTLLSATSIPTGEEKILTVKVHGHENATNDHIWKTMTFCVKNVAGTAILVGGVDSATGYDVGASTWAIVAGVSTENATITVTGEAAHAIDWRATIIID